MSLVECPYCHLNYDDESSIDKRIHSRRHKKWQKIEKTLQYLPRPYGQREAMKSQAYKLIYEGETQEQKLHGCMLLFRAHFDRSLCAAINKNYWQEHPTFEKYSELSASLQSRKKFSKRAGIHVPFNPEANGQSSPTIYSGCL